MSFQSIEEILACAKKEGLRFWEVIRADDTAERNVTIESSMNYMGSLWEAMVAADEGYDKTLLSASGMVGGNGGRMEEYMSNNEPICGGFMGQAIMRALKMGESNACMRKIVAAPTAGSCGVLPAVLVTFYKEKDKSVEQIIEAFYVAAGIGAVIAARASISGAEGGCQAEVGAASAMAAGAAVHLMGGNDYQLTFAAAMALKNLLGLVCDPVAGLVEVPCVKRNVIGAVNALAAADMAMAGVKSRIPLDQVIDAMREVGDAIPSSLRETGKGGLAATPYGQKIARRMKETDKGYEI